MSIQTPVINVIVGAARKAARGLARDLGEAENLQTSIKGADDFAAAAQRRAEDFVRRELSHARPNYGWLSDLDAEEGKDPTRRWIVSALNGFQNLAHGSSHFAVSIALTHKSDVTAAVVLDVVGNRIYTAERGQGAYCDDRRLRASARRDVGSALLGAGFSGGADAPDMLGDLSRAAPRAGGIRVMGCPALDLAAVAAGRLDGYWTRGAAPGGVAAAMLIAREAGAICTDFNGDAPAPGKGDLVAGATELHVKLLGLLRRD